uniref:Uncharacterized protein n=1 Tax=Pristionchus pacificus TaxID=54126 RepID=A0A2A6BA64_PRIPA|eukprot:PDM62754.1 hypothetical protein PRIPAC_49969 [Pristionchus pacificus]
MVIERVADRIRRRATLDHEQPKDVGEAQEAGGHARLLAHQHARAVEVDDRRVALVVADFPTHINITKNMCTMLPMNNDVE